MNAVTPYLKALAGGVVSALSYAVPIVDDGVVPSEWLGLALAFVVGTGLVYVIPNRDPQALHQDESVQPPNFGRGERGAVDPLYALVVALVAVVLLVVLFRVL